MSTRELHRLEVFSRDTSEALRLVDAAEMLALSYRQTKRLWRRYRREGASGLQHRSAGRESHRAKPRAFRDQVLGLLREKYSGGPEEPRFGPTLAAEHLAEEDGLHIVLAKAVAARRAGKGACVPPGAAENAAPGCTPAPLPEPSPISTKGTFLSR